LEINDSLRFRDHPPRFHANGATYWLIGLFGSSLSLRFQVSVFNALLPLSSSRFRIRSISLAHSPRSSATIWTTVESLVPTAPVYIFPFLLHTEVTGSNPSITGALVLDDGCPVVEPSGTSHVFDSAIAAALCLTHGPIARRLRRLSLSLVRLGSGF